MPARNAVPGRNNRDADELAGKAAARIPGGPVTQGRKSKQVWSGRPHHGGNQSQHRAGYRRKQIARGSILSPERLHPSCSALAAAERRDSASAGAFYESVGSPL